MPTAAKRSTSSKARTRAQRAAKSGTKANGAKPKPAAKAEVGAREAGRKRDAELAPKIAKARKDGMSWGDIKEKFGVDQPKGQVLIKMANLKPADRITYKNDGDLGRQAAKLRKTGMSWADIAVRAGVTIAKVKAVFEATTGESAGESRVSRAAQPAKAAAKRGTARRGSAAKGKRAAAVGGGKDPS